MLNKVTNTTLKGIILLLTVLSSTNLISKESIKITSADQLELIGKKTYYYEDVDGNFTINDILSNDIQSKFKLHDKEVFNRPATRSTFWFKINIENYSNADSWIEIGSNYAWYIDFYAPDSSNNYSQAIKTGTMRPDTNKVYDVNFFWLPLNKKDEQLTKTYYLRIKSGMTYELPLQVGTIKSLSKNKDIHDYLTAGFVGLMLIMFLYNTFIYISTRDNIYLFYLGYLLLMLLSMPYANGYPFIQKIDFWFLNKEWINNKFLFWHPFVYFFVGEFCIRYLDLKHKGKRIRRFIQIEMLIISGIFPLLTLLGVAFVDLVNAIQALILIFYLTCLFTGYYYALKGMKQAIYYVTGWTFMVAGAFIFFAVVNGFLPFNPLTRNTLYFGVAIEVWMFSLALGNRLNILQKEKEEIQQENFVLVSKQNQILEQKVAERTLALEKSNNELLQRNTELKQTTEKLDQQAHQLKDLNASKDRLFAIVSHDLRNPLLTLKNLLELISIDYLDTEQFKEESGKIKDDVETIYLTLNNLLQWALTQMQGLNVSKDAFDLDKVITENIKLFKDFAANKKIDIKYDDKFNCAVYGDADIARLVLRNLLNNALKFTAENGMVSIHCSSEGDFCKVCVKDTGIGMNQELVSSLFNEQAIDSMYGTKGEKGTGLGLILCKEFAEKNGGKIWAESSIGEGSEFYFTIPVKQT